MPSPNRYTLRARPTESRLSAPATHLTGRNHQLSLSKRATSARKSSLRICAIQVSGPGGNNDSSANRNNIDHPIILQMKEKLVDFSKDLHYQYACFVGPCPSTSRGTSYFPYLTILPGSCQIQTALDAESVEIIDVNGDQQHVRCFLICADRYSEYL
eukprot:9495520-Pyramimonas_sp.AAC.1